jgi:predicted secreted protein
VSGAVGPGSEPGAPARPRLWSKVIWTTVVSAVVFAVFQVIYRYRLVDLDDLATLWGLLRSR